MITIILSAFLTILGLAVFETVNSLDNAVINASILGKMNSAKARRFFVTWGMLFSVGLVRGVLPFLIYFVPNANLGVLNAMRAFGSGDPRVTNAVHASAPLLLMAGGCFLVLLFLHWFLAEEKDACFWFEHCQGVGGVWFFAVASGLMVGLLYCIRLGVHPAERAMEVMLAASIGIAMFFLADGFKENAEAAEQKLLDAPDSVAVSSMSDWAKVLFLEVIDATFSTDGVIGAFAFTMVVPYILIGNGIGAYVVRKLTLGNLDKISSYKFLKNGALYSIGFLGVNMVLEGFGFEFPGWVSPAITFGAVGLFFWRSVVANRKPELAAATARSAA